MRINWFSYIRVTGLFLVLIYHFFPSILPGGFIGVDVFFTFSGYLITALLIDEVSRTHRIDYLGFMQTTLLPDSTATCVDGAYLYPFGTLGSK